MATFTRLRDFYSFPGFKPATHVRGLFGDPYAVVIPLRRGSKKRPAAFAAPFTARTTTKPRARSEISTPAGDASTSRCPFVASPAACVMP
jgi:hypothetical protein